MLIDIYGWLYLYGGLRPCASREPTLQIHRKKSYINDLKSAEIGSIFLNIYFEPFKNIIFLKSEILPTLISICVWFQFNSFFYHFRKEGLFAIYQESIKKHQRGANFFNSQILSYSSQKSEKVKIFSLSRNWFLFENIFFVSHLSYVTFGLQSSILT